MSDVLVLIGGDAPFAPMAWALVDANGDLRNSGMVDDARPPAAAPARTVLVLPGADARLKRLELPARSDAQARAGAEMMFGATLTGGDTHYAVGAQQDKDGARLTAAISGERLTQWLARAKALGADPHVVVLDCTIWPTAEGEVVIAATDARTIVAGGRFGGFSIEPDIAPTLVARWLQEVGAQHARIVVEGGDARAFARGVGRELEQAPLPDPLATLARAAAAAPSYAPNLRQGPFAPAGRDREPFKLWRFAALLLVAAVMLQVGSLAIAGWRDDQAAKQILEAAERDFRAARPDVRRIVNLRAQVAALANAMQQSQHHPVIVVSEPVLGALRQQPLARLDEVSHQGPGREVRLVVSAPEPAALENFAMLLRGQNVEVAARDQQPRGGRYVVELTVAAP